jgi:hypothetical protein
MFYGKDWMDVTIDEFIQKINAYVLWYNAERIKGFLCGQKCFWILGLVTADSGLHITTSCYTRRLPSLAYTHFFR